MSRVGVVAPNTILGRELRERLAARSDRFVEVRLLSSDEEEIGQLAESGGAAAFVARLDENAFDGLELVFFCGEIDGDRPWIERLPEAVHGVVLSTGSTTSDGAPALAGIGRAGFTAGPHLALHPAAFGAALLLARLGGLGPRAAQAVAVLPVSMHGEAALEALFEQTRAVLSFQPPGKGPLREQIAFDVALAADGADDVARQVAGCLGGEIAIEFQLLAAGVFHGVGLSLRVELDAGVDADDVRRTLAGDPRIDVARKPGTASPVKLAGDESVRIGEIRPGGAPGTFWIWAAYDNVTRGGALAAIELAEELLADGAVSA